MGPLFALIFATIPGISLSFGQDIQWLPSALLAKAETQKETPLFLMQGTGDISTSMPYYNGDAKEDEPAPAGGWFQEMNFNHENSSSGFITSRELRIWASQRNLALAPDCPLQNLQDFEAATIPAEGISFSLQPRYHGRQYLYLDLVTYTPLSEANPEGDEGLCSPSLTGSRRVQGAELDLPSMQWLTIYVNGKKTRTLYMGRDVLIQSPVVIPIEREYLQGGKISVLLRPGPGDSIFAIWDAFLSRASPD